MNVSGLSGNCAVVYWDSSSSVTSVALATAVSPPAVDDAAWHAVTTNASRAVVDLSGSLPLWVRLESGEAFALDLASADQLIDATLALSTPCDGVFGSTLQEGIDAAPSDRHTSIAVAPGMCAARDPPSLLPLTPTHWEAHQFRLIPY